MKTIKIINVHLVHLTLKRFFVSGAFLLTPSHDLSLDKAANICDKLNFRGSFSLTKTATGILFKFSEPDDFQQVFRKGFHKVSFVEKFLFSSLMYCVLFCAEMK